MDRFLPSQATERTACQTLLWIGPRDAAELRQAYDYCERSASQIAYRQSIADAKRRPAMGVDRVLFTRLNRASFDWHFANSVLSESDEMRAACLIGSLCDGIPHNERFAIAESDRLRIASPTTSENQKLKIIKSHAWNQSLPPWLHHAEGGRSVSVITKKTVAVVAATFAAAEPILDLIGHLGHSGIWLRSPDSVRVRNIDQVIWDDSLASPATFQEWQSCPPLIAGSKNTSHAWIASSPRIDQTQLARRAGIDFVLSKPFDCNALIQWLVQEQRVGKGVTHLQSNPAERSNVAA